MTLKIEKISDRQNLILRLIGRIHSEHLEQLKTLIEDDSLRVMLNLDEVTIVDLEGVRFLRVCEAKGVELLNCPPYIREWILREKEEEGKQCSMANVRGKETTDV